MKKVIVRNAQHVDTEKDLAHATVSAILSGHDLEVSDGYHSFDELYDHRATLYIALCRYLKFSSFVGTPIWRSLLHSDGTSFEDMFIMGIGVEKGRQITYHLPISLWDDTAFAETRDKAPKWDGHTSEDVIIRLKNL